MNTKLVLTIILILGLFFRVVGINNNPPSLYGDELTINLDAYSILKTGHDQLGNFLPLTFEMGAGRPGVYVYGSVPFVALFGPSTLGVRMLSILSGLGIILLLYYIGRKLFSERVGLISSAIGAVSLWDISLSRGGFEAHFALFLALLGIYFFIKAEEKPQTYILSAICFGLTLHTYPTYKVTLFLFLPLLAWYRWRRNSFKSDLKYLVTGILIFLFLGLIALSQTFVADSEIRFSDINIFSQSQLQVSIKEKINSERKLTQLPQWFARYLHNKPIEYTKILIENYLQNFSIDFLVLHGDKNPRHNMATMGQFYAIELFLILAGLLVIWQEDKRTALFLLFWIVLSPVSTAIVGQPHALRSAFMLPPLLFLSATGLNVIINQRKKIILSIVSIVFIVQFTFFIQKLYFLAPYEYSNFWSYSGKLASETAINNKNKYDFVIVADKIDSVEFAYPLYAKVDPKIIISQNKDRVLLNDYLFKKFDNVYIGYIPDTLISSFLSSLSGSYFYIGLPSDAKFLQPYETLQGPDKKDTILIHYP
ncbi:MAG: glycosyltransferase family 39 protein [Candidatus Daviesbacteria bacterium]|nr:glycosyltransferase family 39 protein [Candidatus Daviesbacteria bacterium]